MIRHGSARWSTDSATRGAGRTKKSKQNTKLSPQSKTVDKVIPPVDVVDAGCPACQLHAELAAKTAAYKGKPWWRRMTQRHPGKKAEKKGKKLTKKATWSFSAPAGSYERHTGLAHVERMGNLGLNLDGTPFHNHPLRENPDESAAGGRRRRRRRTKRRTRRSKGRKGRKGRRTRRR